jgi:uncharacterized RDD family membrane protein YckC
MSLAGAPMTAPISLAAASGRALPRRLLALVVDTLVISLLDAIVNGAFGVAQVTNDFATTLGNGGFGSLVTRTTVGWPWLALQWVTYYALLEGLFGATLGKRLTGLRVTDLEGRRITRQAAIVRNVARVFDWLPFLYLLGGALTLISARHQRYGDRIARTLVVPASALTGPPLPRDVGRRRAIGLAAATALLLVICALFAYYGRPPLVIEGARNTGEAFFSQGVSSYSLGSAHWGKGTVSYAITYRIAPTNQSCFGDVTLHWTWLGGGWVFSGGKYFCSTRAYP